eukprot:1157779-Pelagomonas_calceolata.AAC.6
MQAWEVGAANAQGTRRTEALACTAVLSVQLRSGLDSMNRLIACGVHIADYIIVFDLLKTYSCLLWMRARYVRWLWRY